MTTEDDGRKKWFHLPETIRQLRRKRPIIMIETPITFFPSLASVIPKLFAKVFANERMGIEKSRVMRIFCGEESRSS
jgi:hypothetical protein